MYPSTVFVATIVVVFVAPFSYSHVLSDSRSWKTRRARGESTESSLHIRHPAAHWTDKSNDSLASDILPGIKNGVQRDYLSDIVDGLVEKGDYQVVSDDGTELVVPTYEKPSFFNEFYGDLYDHYTYNDKFMKKSFPKVKKSNYDYVEEVMVPIRDYIVEHGHLPPLKNGEAKKWNLLREAVENSISDDDGVIIYDYFKAQWIYCGFFKFPNGFSSHISHLDVYKMCAPLLVLGLTEVSRPPLAGKDFLLPSNLANRVQKIKGHPSPPRNRAYVDVDLFKTAEADTSSICLTEDVDRSCPPMCCYSAYNSEGFCGAGQEDCLYVF